ncbi:uncharacterized protein YeaO (DUF488 family) [Catalinimonas alkaloidigena]|uniref:DUF488 domain-containing protein n=1 Tax=Catalinimonas alkaloidigena TaxID=1075417 RepID=UPI002406B21A|nr:DUF488 domain-containing protein [Catalinimonas alkaloidigena]MDF9801364.1 uncharacterized protein YeaO (DUF488 family) [Catalinimonas alkaloidigena]
MMDTVNCNLKIKRIYEEYSKNDGYRILIDRIWPRGIKKKDAKLDAWMKEIAPSSSLRKWFGHEAEKFDEFSAKYREELSDKRETLQKILAVADSQKLTLLYAAKDTKMNHAVVLLNFLNNSI